ncbi:MAG: DUF4149 domain-containing protein [Helicobacter sp.]|nr:DUF4149 domain-containing protein [Helicobacter sp.]
MNPKLVTALFQALTIFYLLMLGFACGVILSLGALSAPVIFRDALIISEGAINAFQAGQIMTEIFIRASYVLLFVAILIAIYEILSATIHSQKRFLIFSAIAIAAILLFVLYYLPAIVEIQKQGEEFLADSNFHTLHQQSVWVFYTAFYALIALFASRLLLLLRHE